MRKVHAAKPHVQSPDVSVVAAKLHWELQVPDQVDHRIGAWRYPAGWVWKTALWFAGQYRHAGVAYVSAKRGLSG